jgi:frataxin-like iron-binding protein CyaY
MKLEIKPSMKVNKQIIYRGADNGTTQQSVIIDCNNGTNVATLKAGKGENYVIGKQFSIV